MSRLSFSFLPTILISRRDITFFSSSLMWFYFLNNLLICLFWNWLSNLFLLNCWVLAEISTETANTVSPGGGSPPKCVDDKPILGVGPSDKVTVRGPPNLMQNPSPRVPIAGLFLRAVAPKSGKYQKNQENSRKFKIIKDSTHPCPFTRY